MTATATRPSLSDLPSMDDIRIGPAGETFSQLKSRVIAARAAYLSQNSEALLDELTAAVSTLKAAYASVGLPYRAP